MKNKIVAVIVALGGFASLAVVSANAAATSTCPPGTTTGSIYCTVGTTSTTTTTTTSTTSTVSTTSTTSVLPQGLPSLLHEELWAGGHHYYYGPALKFKVKNGINGAPGIAKVVFTLPSGFSIDPASSVIKYDLKHGLSYKGSTITYKYAHDPLSVLVYIKNHGILESQKLRNEIKNHKVKSESFDVHVTDTAGLATTLLFKVKAQDSK